MIVCDSQVHAPNLPPSSKVTGLDREELVEEMAAASVQRCIVVPLAAPGTDISAYNPAALRLAQAEPDRFAVMGRFDLTRPSNRGLLAGWRTTPGMLGVRVAITRPPNLALFHADAIDWFWSASENAGVPVMVLVPHELLGKLGQVAARYPGLRLTVDHFGLTPYEQYRELNEAIRPLLKLARHANVAVKASALPAAVADPFPFRSLHDSIYQVVDAFGPQRVFWGSDLTRLPCTYSECVRLFTEELPLLSTDAKEWIMGRAVMDWLSWDSTGVSDYQ